MPCPLNLRHAAFALAGVLVLTTFGGPAIAAESLFSGPEQDLRETVAPALGCEWIGDMMQDRQTCEVGGSRGVGEVEFFAGVNRSLILAYVTPGSDSDADDLKIFERDRANAKKLVRAVLPEWKQAEAWLEASMSRYEQETGCGALMRVSSAWVAIGWSSTNAAHASGVISVIIAADSKRFVDENGLQETIQ